MFRAAMMVCSRFTLLQRGLTPRNQHQLMRNLVMLSAGSSIWNSVKANSIQKTKPVCCNLPASNMSNFSSKVDIPVVEYAEVKDLPQHPEKLLIDVREPDEIKKTGLIPTALQIPLGRIREELDPNTRPDEFEKNYGRPKPDSNTYIIMQCQSGKRSQNAAQIVRSLGYINVHNYVGSWLDWAEREGLPKVPK